MPVNSNIALSIKPQQQDASFLDKVGQISHLKNLAQIGKQNALQLKRLERQDASESTALEREARVREVLGSGELSPQAKYLALNEVDPSEATKYRTELRTRGDANRSILGGVAAGMKGKSPEVQAQIWSTAAEWLEATGASDLAQQMRSGKPDPDALIALVRKAEEQLDENWEREKLADAKTKTVKAGEYVNEDGFKVIVWKKPDGTTFETRTNEKVGAAPRAPVPGTDVPFRQDVMDQKEDIANRQRPITGTAEAGMISRLTSQWDRVNAPVVDLDQQVKRMDAGMFAAERGDMNAGSQAVLVTFQKVLDEESVVRESEYARSPQGQGLFDRIRGIVPRLQHGGPGVTIEELKTFQRLAREIVNSTRDYVASVKERIGRNADRYNLPRDLIFEDYMPGGRQDPGDTSILSSESVAEPTAVNPKTGETLVLRNGKWVKQ